VVAEAEAGVEGVGVEEVGVGVEEEEEEVGVEAVEVEEAVGVVEEEEEEVGVGVSTRRHCSWEEKHRRTCIPEVIAAKAYRVCSSPYHLWLVA
jgi:GTPase